LPATTAELLEWASHIGALEPDETVSLSMLGQLALLLSLPR
jgi:hypothetical protein